MGEVKEFRLKDGSLLYIETEVADIPEATAFQNQNDLPDGAESTSTAEKLKDTMDILKDALKNTANIVNEGIRLTKPDEWTLEINIGFIGKANPIPVILSGESKASLKVTAKWSKKG